MTDNMLNKTADNLLERAWVLIANASHGFWERELPEWRNAAARWRDEYHETLGQPASASPAAVGTGTREREQYITAKREGALEALAFFDVFDATEDGNRQRRGWIARTFPLPRVTRPRIVRDPMQTSYGPASGLVGELYWMVRDGFLDTVTKEGYHVHEWENDQRRDSYPTPARVKLWSDLLCRPTEEVDPDADLWPNKPDGAQPRAATRTPLANSSDRVASSDAVSGSEE